MLQHFSSDDSNEKKILSSLEKRDPLTKKKKSGKKKADRVFELLSQSKTETNDKVKMEEIKELETGMKKTPGVFELLQQSQTETNGKVEMEEIKKLKTKHLSGKLLELMKSAEDVPADSIPTHKIQATKTKIVPKSSETSEVNIMETIKQVAVTVGGELDNTEKELLKAFHSILRHPSAHPETNITSDSKTKKQKFRNFLSQSGPGLGIFQTDMQEDDRRPILETWNHLEAVTLTSLKQHPARNYFEELINWTYQGKLWHFPIDNEQDWEEEKATDFTDHIFLDKHLEGWCPKAGPIRHFMELVTVGLSKNPYISAEKKREHIMWYKDYFQSKNTLLNELGISSQQTKSNVGLLESEEIKRE